MHRSLVWLGIVVAALALAAPALAVKVHVRVESANDHRLGRQGAVGHARVRHDHSRRRAIRSPSARTPRSARSSGPASAASSSTPRSRSRSARSSNQIGRLAGTANTGWVYKVNGISPPVGATDYVLKKGDRVLWYYATFGPTGGPKTLVLEKQRKPKLCFTARQQDDAGVKSAVGDVVFRVNGHAVRSKSGTLCPKRVVRTVRVSKAGLVRSAILAGAQSPLADAPRLHARSARSRSSSSSPRAGAGATRRSRQVAATRRSG